MAIQKTRIRNPVMQQQEKTAAKSSFASRVRELKKESGPYKVLEVVGLPGGVERKGAKYETGIHVIGIDETGQKRVSVRLSKTIEELYVQLGTTADCYVGKLFKINKDGEGDLIDRSGTADMLGETRSRPPNVIASSMPISVMGVFGMNFPAIADVMSLLRRE